jgi:hypothetical protein
LFKNSSTDIRDSLWTGQGIDEEPFTGETRALIHTSASRHTVVPFFVSLNAIPEVSASFHYIIWWFKER